MIYLIPLRMDRNLTVSRLTQAMPLAAFLGNEVRLQWRDRMNDRIVDIQEGDRSTLIKYFNHNREYYGKLLHREAELRINVRLPSTRAS